MLIRIPGGSRRNHSICLVCGKQITGIGSSLEVCPECVRLRWEESRGRIESLHARSRLVFGLPALPPADPAGLQCKICFHRCRIGKQEIGYCGIRKGTEESFRLDGRLRARVSTYFDPLPTNCVADWVCAGGTGAGYPHYARDKGPEVGYYNLAVFFEACNLNCLYCQNWHFKKSQAAQHRWKSIDALAGLVNLQTTCICYFGGDPAPQIPYALRLSKRIREEHPDKVLRICWETNGSMSPAYVKSMVRLSLDSGGCIKMDLKAWNPQMHRALCGCDNRQILENFQMIAQWVPLRPDPPLLVASTLLVPGYVDVEEVSHLATFIAGLNPDIPYTLLAFAPQFCLEDFPTTSLAHAEACLAAAKKAGLSRVRIANRHLLN